MLPTSSRIRSLPVLLAVAVAGAGAVACSDPAPPPRPKLEVPVVQVVQRDQPVTLEMVGQTFGSSDIPIRARVEGVLLGMHFVEGSTVEKGQLLYTVDPTEYDSKVVEAKGHLAEAITRLAKTEADLARIRPLAEMHAVSQVDLDSATAQYEAALGSLQAAEARLDQAEIELGYTKIAAPITGRIGITEAKVGEFVGREPNPVVLNFTSRTDPIRVRFSIDERRYLLLARRLRDDRVELAEEPGAGDLELILADGSVHDHPGRVVALAASIDAATGTFTLEADFANPDDIVIAGQFARVRAVIDNLEGAVLVPQRSITELQGMFRAYVIGADGKVELRPVELGAKFGQLQIVESGLAPGEQIALEIMRLQPGMEITPRLVELDDAGAEIKRAAAREPAPSADAGA